MNPVIITKPSYKVKGSGSHLQSQNVKLNKNNGMYKLIPYRNSSEKLRTGKLTLG